MIPQEEQVASKAAVMKPISTLTLYSKHSLVEMIHFLHLGLEGMMEVKKDLGALEDLEECLEEFSSNKVRAEPKALVAKKAIKSSTLLLRGIKLINLPFQIFL